MWKIVFNEVLQDKDGQITGIVKDEGKKKNCTSIDFL